MVEASIQVIYVMIDTNRKQLKACSVAICVGDMEL